MAEAEYFEKTPKKANRWFGAFIILSLLFGITFSLNYFFNWIFFLGAGYSLFMSYFLLPVQPKIFQARPNRPKATQFNSGGRAGQSATVQTPAAIRRRNIFIIVGVFFFFLVFVPFVIGMFEGVTEETSTGNSVSDLDEYALVAKGNDFFNQQQYDSAERYYEAALDVNPDHMEAVYGKGIVAYNRENTDLANTYFVKAYEGGFRFGWLSWALADMYDKQGQTTRAIELYKESASLDSTNVDNYKRLAELEPANQSKYLELAQKYANN